MNEAARILLEMIKGNLEATVAHLANVQPVLFEDQHRDLATKAGASAQDALEQVERILAKD